jgi:lipopolysaccharide/colanic/teichoic acid biosynthesis glycosyltransferase
VDAIVARFACETDWESALPPRAAGWGWHAAQAAKRAADFVLAAAALVVVAPIILLLALAVAVESPGPLFYPWRVLGYRGRRFTGYKIRTMVPDADRLKASLLHRNEMTGPAFKMRDDPRVTRVGRWLRKYSLDELPQLWSVMVGDMSLVGPRPPSAAEFVRFEAWQRCKLSVRPGITCLWQVSGRSEISEFSEWAQLDLEYIQCWSLGLDVSILRRTIPTVLSGRGAY